MQKQWHKIVTEDPSQLAEFMNHYEVEYLKARHEAKIEGSLEQQLMMLPGIVDYRYGQLQEIEYVLKYFNIQLSKIRSQVFRNFTEKYNRALGSREAEKYCDHDTDVVNMETIVNEIAFIRNRWLGLLKAFEYKHFQLSNVVKLRIATMEDVYLNN